MREDRLEEKIKKLLNDSQEDYDMSSWDKLSKRLDDHPELLDSSQDDFIPIIKDKLDRQRASVPEEHWSMMNSELDDIQDRKRRLYIVKFLEAAIILLLVFTYFHYTWYGTDVEMDMAYIEDIKATSEDPSLVHAALGYTEDQKDRQLQIVALAQEVRNKSVSILNTLPTSPSDPASVTTLDQRSVDIPSIHFGNDALALQNAEVVTSDNSISTLEIKPLEALSTLPYLVMTETKDTEIFTSDGWTFGLPITYDVNFINTDLNLGYLSNQIESGLGGRSYGVSIGYRKKNIEIESGIRYSEKTFVPGKLTNYTKTSEISFLENQLDNMVIKQIEIPLFFKFYASPVRNTSLYGVLGFGANAIIHNQYQISRSIQPKARLNNAPTSDIVDLQDLPGGIIRGESIKDNIYLTGVVGFGIESALSPEVKWYVQPQYQHSLTGEINQIVDRVNTLSIEAGVKFSF